MRPATTLALALAPFLLATACRKIEQPAREAEPAPPAAAREPGPPQPPAPAAAQAAEEKAEPEPSAAARAEPPAAPIEARVEAAPAAPAPAAEPTPGEGAIYRWEDAQGVVHFSPASAVPASRKASARLVTTGLSAVTAEQVTLPAPPAAPSDTSAVIAPQAEAARREPGDQPERDEQGLPIPGTMKETAHSRAVKAATGGVGVDPASVERRREEDDRRMRCRVVDGVKICG